MGYSIIQPPKMTEWWEPREDKEMREEQWERHTADVRDRNVTGKVTKDGLVIERRPMRRKWPWTGLFSRKRRIGRG